MTLWRTFRVCPGMYLADRVVFHIVTTINSLFHVVPLQGKRIPDPDTVVYTDVLIRYATAAPDKIKGYPHDRLNYRLPVGFECRFVPRDEKALQLIGMVSLIE